MVMGVTMLGCSSEPDNVGPADVLAGDDLSVASPEQAAEIADRVATEAEYHAAFARYEECMAAGGYPLGSVRMEGKLYEFAVPAAAVESSDVDATCYETEYRYTDILWQTSAEVADSSPTTEALRECLRERGVEPAESAEGISEQLANEGIDVGECLL